MNQDAKGQKKVFNIRSGAGFFTARIDRRTLLSYLALVICPIVTFYLFDLYTHNPFTSMDFKTQMLNIAFYELTGVMLFGLLRYLRLALMLQSGLFMIIGLANYYVFNFRSAPIMPWDIFSISTAASVADNFSYALEKEAVLVVLGFLGLLFVESRLNLKAPKRKRGRLLMVCLPFVMLIGYTNMIQSDSFISRFGLYDKLFTPAVMNKRDGNVVAFLMEMEYLNVEKPEGYSASDIKQLYHSRNSKELLAAIEEPESVKRPNIIVIMDEAFSDPAVLGKLKTNQDYMPFIHSLQKGADNTITGYLNVSVLGGNTANTEFEFLTGHSMAFLPQGSVAYQQYLKEEEPSLASYLKQLGYSTVAMHPYYEDGWDRSRVYPLLGFDEFLAIDDFAGAKKLRKYVSDEACFDRIIKLYEEKEKGQPLFVFNVTMQNHSGYEEEFANFKSDVTVEGSSSKALSRYLSLMKVTDKALENLIAYFEEADEDTIIVFFGDHQPTTYVSNPVFRLNGIDPNTLTDEENLLRYKVPYVIWSNFNILSGKDKETSANFLAVELLESCGLPLPPYQSYLSEIKKEFPIITALQVQGHLGKTGLPGDWTDYTRETLNPYRSLQYYMLFDYDKTNRRNLH